MKFIFLFLFTISLSTAFSQEKQTITYYNVNNKEIKNPNNAEYSKIVTAYGSNKYRVLEKYKNGNIKHESTMEGVEPNLHYIGHFINYNKNGGKKTILNFDRKYGLTGDAYFFYPNGDLEEHRFFFKKGIKNAPRPLNYKMMQMGDSLGNVFLDGKGNGTFSEKLINGDSKSGEYLNGFKTGLWKSYNAELKESYEDEYIKNNFIKGKTIHSDGSILYYNELKTEPTFNGGQKSFDRFLTKNSKFPINTRNNNDKRRVYLVFKVEKTGELTDLRISSGFSDEYNQEALRIFKLSPKWIPGTFRGKKERVQEGSSVVFKL